MQNLFLVLIVKVLILVWQSFKEIFLQQLVSAEIGFLWTDKENLLGVLSRISENIEDDTRIARDSLAFVFAEDLDVNANTQKTLEFLHTHLAEQGAGLSLAAMCLAAFELFGGFEDKKNLVHPVLAAAVFGEVPNNLAYHNNCHFKKVLLHTIRLIAAHNRMFKGMNNVFKEEHISQLLAVACVHDIGHEAKGNFVDRKYVFAAQEQKSFGYIKPFFLLMGYTPEQCEDVRIMFMTTDVTPFGDISSPANQLRVAYEMHFGTSDYDDNITLCEPLRILEENSNLCLMCMMLHEADIMNSAGVDYDTTVAESIRVSREMNKTSASPEDTYLFFKMICHESMTTDAAQYLASENLKQISARVNDDIRNGILSYDMTKI